MEWRFATALALACSALACAGEVMTTSEQTALCDDDPDCMMARATSDEAIETVPESVACEELVTAYQDRGIELGCPTTTRMCPDHLRVRYGACLLYERSTMDRCIAMYQRASSCEGLYASFECDVATIDDSNPAGCGNGPN